MNNNLVFDLREEEYYDTGRNIFLPEDDVQFLKLPNPQDVINASQTENPFTYNDHGDIIVNDTFVRYFDKIRQTMLKAQETIDKRLEEYDKTLRNDETTYEKDGEKYQ